MRFIFPLVDDDGVSYQHEVTAEVDEDTGDVTLTFEHPRRIVIMSSHNFETLYNLWYILARS